MRSCYRLCRGSCDGNEVSTFLYSIKDHEHSNIADDMSYYGIIEMRSGHAVCCEADAPPWKTTLEDIRHMDLQGKTVSLTNISASRISTNPNKFWIEVVMAFHDSGAKHVRYKN